MTKLYSFLFQTTVTHPPLLKSLMLPDFLKFHCSFTEKQFNAQKKFIKGEFEEQNRFISGKFEEQNQYLTGQFDDLKNFLTDSKLTEIFHLAKALNTKLEDKLNFILK